LEKVQEVIHKLKITHMEVRTDDDDDVKPYIKTRMEEVVEVKNSRSNGGPVENLRKRFFSDIMTYFVNRLKQNGVTVGNCSKGGVFNAYITFKSLGLSNNSTPNAQGTIHECFGVLISLAHSHDLLRDYGLVDFVKSLEKFAANDKSQRGGARKHLVQSSSWKNLVKTAQQLLHEGTYVHPKMLVLHQVLMDHFGRAKSCNKATRVIVFAQWRTSVVAIVNYIRRKESGREGAPLLKPHRFVGQSSGDGGGGGGGGDGGDGGDGGGSYELSKNVGMNQKVQEAVVRGFTGGKYNVLVSTSIGEEGLDIGQVDLIVAYDGM
jgi:ERCC4-related helicase